MLGEGLITLVQDIFMMLAILIVMFIINWKLAFITFVVLPFVIFFMLKFKVDIRKVYRLVRIRLAKINTSLSENISGIQTIQLFHQEKKKQNEFESVTQDYFEAERKQLRIFAVFRPLIDVMVHLAIALIIWYGGGSILQDKMSLGVLVVFISYVHRFFDPLYDLSQKYNVMQSAMAALERIFKLMDEKEEHYSTLPQYPKRLQGEIEFKNVWMAYKNEDWILKDINLKITKGEKVALVGSTGGGKTTLVKLVSSFYPFQKGNILIDGKSIKIIISKNCATISVWYTRMSLFSQARYAIISLCSDKIFPKNRSFRQPNMLMQTDSSQNFQKDMTLTQKSGALCFLQVNASSLPLLVYWSGIQVFLCWMKLLQILILKLRCLFRTHCIRLWKTEPRLLSHTGSQLYRMLIGSL